MSQAAVSQSVARLGAGALPGGKVAVDADHDQEGPGDIAQGFERDGDRGDGGLQPVGAQIVAQPPHQPRVVDLADRIFFTGAGRLRLVVFAGCAWGFIFGVALLRVRHAGLVFDSQLHCTG